MRRYFLRLGNLPINGKSGIYQRKDKVGEEIGISVFECTQDTYQIILPKGIPNNLIDDLYQFFNRYNRPLYLVSGVQIGVVSDNEPLIADAKIEKELSFTKEIFKL